MLLHNQSERSQTLIQFACATTKILYYSILNEILGNLEYLSYERLLCSPISGKFLRGYQRVYNLIL